MIFLSLQSQSSVCIAVKKPKKVKSPARPEISSMYRDEDAGSLTGSSHTISSDGTPISPQSTSGSSTRTANGGSPKINKQTPADNANTRGGLTGVLLCKLDSTLSSNVCRRTSII